MPQQDKEIFAVKTGRTEQAQEAMITKVLHKGRVFVIIVLGSNNREADTLSIKDQLLNNIAW